MEGSAVHVGTPKPDFDKDDVNLVHFHDFKNLTTVRDEMVESPEFICAGHKWKLQLFPGGDAEEDRNEDWMSLHLLSLKCLELCTVFWPICLQRP